MNTESLLLIPEKRIAAAKIVLTELAKRQRIDYVEGLDRFGQTKKNQVMLMLPLELKI